jgi:hypothetical protein
MWTLMWIWVILALATQVWMWMLVMGKILIIILGMVWVLGGLIGDGFCEEEALR